MGLDPATLGLIATIGGGVGSSLFAPQGQQISSFENSPGGTDPHDTLQNAGNEIQRLFDSLMQRSSEPIDMSHSYVQELPSFSGGGLPMPVGVTGSWEGGNRPAALPSANPGGAIGGTRAPRLNAPGEFTPPRPTVDLPPPTDLPGRQFEPQSLFESGSAEPTRRKFQPTGTGISTGGDQNTIQPFGAGAGSDAGTSLLPSPPPGMDPRAYGAVQLLMQLANQGQQAA